MRADRKKHRGMYGYCQIKVTSIVRLLNAKLLVL